MEPIKIASDLNELLEGKSNIDIKHCYIKNLPLYFIRYLDSNIVSNYIKIKGKYYFVANMRFSIIDDVYFKYLKLHYIEVEKIFRGKGIGKRMINYLKLIAKENNCERIQLDSINDAVEFYLSLGFKIDDTFSKNLMGLTEMSYEL